MFLPGISTGTFTQRCEDMEGSQRTQIFNIDDTLISDSSARHCNTGVVFQETTIAALGDSKPGNRETGSPRNRGIKRGKAILRTN